MTRLALSAALAAASLTGLPARALAQTAPAAPAEEVTVPGRAAIRQRGGSDFSLPVGELGTIPRANASELLKLAPGIFLANAGGDGHAEQVFLRGFDAREGQDIEFTVGGVPINEAGNLHGNGYADTHFIIPELVQSLRVIEGPFAPQQGNFAAAGSADFELGLERRGITGKYSRGSFGHERLLVLWGPNHENAQTFGGVEIYSSDGFGQNRDAQRGTAMGQYDGSFGTAGRWRVTTTAYSSSYHSAGVLREDDYEAGRVRFYDTYDTFQGGTSSRYSIAGEISTRAQGMGLSQQVWVVARSMRLRENFTGFTLDPQLPSQAPHAQRGDRIDLSTSSISAGGRGSARWRTLWNALPQEIEVGYFARGDSGSGTQYRVETATGQPYHLDADLESKLGNIGAYGDLNVQPLRWLTLRGGARADVFTFDVVNHCAVQSVARPSTPVGDASCLSQQDSGSYREPTSHASTVSTAVLPRATVLLGPVQSFTLSASVGEGVRSIDPIYVTQDAVTPFASIVAYEGGLAYAASSPSLAFTARSVFFQTSVDREIVFDERAGRNVLGGATTRTGWMGALRARGSFFDESANVTLVNPTFDDTNLIVPYVPQAVVRSDTALFRDLPWKPFEKRMRAIVSSGISFVGRRGLPYGQNSDSILTVDGAATLSWNDFDLGIAATNLLGERYRLGEYNYASDYQSAPNPSLVTSRHFTAGAPRTILVSLAATFGGP